MRVVYMGTPDFAVPALQAIAGCHEVVAVVTQPDRPKGRGGKVLYPPVKEAALKLKVPVMQPLRVREPAFMDALEELGADVIVVAAFGQILPPRILSMPRYGCVNIHASLLPKYRGAAPVQWAVINGETVSGVTTMQMDEGLDTGDMLEKTEVFLAPDETGGSLHDKLAAASAPLILSTLEKLASGTLKGTPQGESPTAYASMLKKSMGDIDFTWSAVRIERLIRGLSPWPSAYTCLCGKTVKIWRARVIGSGYPSGLPGEVLESGAGQLVVAAGEGALCIEELQLEGKKRMGTADFLRGFKVETGTILGGKG